MKSIDYGLAQTGLGFRREMMESMLQAVPHQAGFLEVAPENWMRMGGKLGKQFRELTQQHTFICHGLSLSIGSPDPLDFDFLRELKHFLDTHDIRLYSEHLSYCSANGHMYDLMPIPFSYESANYVAQRVKQVQDVLERPLVLENVSYYGAPSPQMSELDFTLEVLEQADCQLLLDVNNIYVNSTNHSYDAEAFLKAMPSERIAYIHVAGHYNEADDLIVDTHGADVIDPVWTLLDKAYHYHGVRPTLLERDFNLPPIAELVKELDTVTSIQSPYLKHAKRA